MADIISFLLGPIFLLVFVTLVGVFWFTGRKSTAREVRDLSPFIRLRRVVGLAVEAGTRLHVSLGWGGLIGVQGASALVGLSLLDRIARAASISDRPPVVTAGDGVLVTLSQNTLRSAYHAMDVDDQYDPQAGQLSGVSPFAYAAGAMTLMQAEQPSANALIGHFGSEVALLAEAGERNGGVVIAGSDNIAAQAVLYAAAHEPLIGEELYAGGVYLGAGAAHTASLKAQDALRWVLSVVLIVGALLKLMGMW